MDGQLIGNRIKQRRTDLKMTQGDIAKKIGVAVSTVQRYEKGQIEKIKLPVIESIARTLQVTPDWLIGKSDSMESLLPSGLMPMPKTYKVPLLGSIACGKPILAVEDACETVDVPEWVKADFALRCQGDSMINARIFPGDIVYIRIQEQVETGQIAAVRIGEEATLKKVYYAPNDEKITLRACNPLYGDMIYQGDSLNEIEILGLAVGFYSKVRHE